ncbi:MAG: tRNA (adenosine(37)-N6)-threonylcarbamoyltransferase complex ATPase subunit type 1 TsaE [Actinomycetota bacterium]
MRNHVGVVTRSPEETRVVGAALAPLLLPGDVISLSGDLGAGKTVFVQGVASAMGVETRVTSPTFTIVHNYAGRYPIVHLDVYRLGSFQEVLDLGFEELLDPEAVMLVEWGEAVAPLLPRRYLEVELRSRLEGDERALIFRPRGVDWTRKLDGMRTTAEALLAAAAPDGMDVARFVDAARLTLGGHKVGNEGPHQEK